MKILNIIFWSLCFQRGGCDLSLLQGKWRSITDLNDSSYFHVKDTSIFAVRENAKLSMDITNFKKEKNILQLQMNNLKIHHAPLYLNVFDLRVFSFMRTLMKHGMTLHFSTLPNATMIVRWSVSEKDKTKILHEGKIMVSNVPDERDTVDL